MSDVLHALALARARFGEWLGLPNDHVALAVLERLERALVEALEELAVCMDDLHRANGRNAVLEDELRRAREDRD